MEVLAQSVRASDCGSEGHGFEPHIPPLIFPLKLGFEGIFVFIVFRYCQDSLSINSVGLFVVTNPTNFQ